MPRESAEMRRASVRLAAQFAALIVVLLAVVGGLVFFIDSAGQSEAAERALVDAAQIDSTDEAPPGEFVAIHAAGQWHVSTGMPAGLPDKGAMEAVAKSGDPVEARTTINGRTYAVRTTAGGGRVTQVVIDQRESQEELQRLLWALVGSGAIAAIAAGFAAAWMSRRAMRPLAYALALQRRFVADASHELRTPLTLLSTRAQMLRRRVPVESDGGGTAIATEVDEIIEDSRMLSEILEDLLIAADPRETAEQAPLDLGAVADDAVNSLQPEAARRGIRLGRAGDTTPVMIRGARVSIHRLYTALISNALDHAKGHVSVETALVGDTVVLRVADDGPGFPEGMDERAFERFASARPADDGDQRPRHYGLGLALVAEVAARHGGGVSIESAEPGPGAVVVVRFPAVG